MSESDLELLQRYCECNSEDAFAELVRRHVSLVHSAALRQVRAPQLAEDVAQAVFLKLARHAGTLAPGTILSAWLYQVTRREAVDLIRREASRRVREQIACDMNPVNSSVEHWTQIEPLLDEAMSALNDVDRASVLLRYFENKSLREVGERLGMSDDAAQKRVRRAVDQLRDFFARRGVVVGAQAFALALSSHAIQAAPAALAATISGYVFAGTTLAGAAAVATTTIAMTATQKALVAATILLTGAGFYQAHRTAELRRQVQALEQRQGPLEAQIQQLADERDRALREVAGLSAIGSPRLPAPRIQPASVPPQSERANLYERFSEKQIRLNPEQAERYLAQNGRNASTLLAAFRTSGDVTLLNEAMEKFPHDPQVAFEAVMRTDATPEMRLAWLDAFKKAAPSNALPNYLTALAHIKSGKTDLAIQELAAASGKSFSDYTSERYQADAEAFLGSGYSVADAKTASGFQLLLPQLHQLKELGLNIVEMAKSYRQGGDEASAQAALQMALQLGQRYSSPSPGKATVSQLVGMALEKHALDAMDPSATWGVNGQTAQERLGQLARQRAEIDERNQQAEELFPKMSDQDWINYRDRWLMFGEASAVQWLVNKARDIR